MSERKIAITKNGYDILRIIEIESDGNACGFKITPQVKIDDINIYCMRLFEEPKGIYLDKTKNFEITYHKSNDAQKTKIALKYLDEDNHPLYVNLPLTKLIDPDVNTEIPIPLLKIIVPDNILYKPYKKDKRHRQFDIGDSNVIEVFLTKAGFINSDFVNKWENVNIALIGNAIEYYACGKDEFNHCNLKTIIKSPRTFCVSADVTKDIGIRINTLKYPKINTPRLSMLFIENEVYLGFLGGSIKMYNSSDIKQVYKYDVDKFTFEERQKWEAIFQREFEKLNNYISSSNEDIIKYFANGSY